jgi:hypothetical protein
MKGEMVDAIRRVIVKEERDRLVGIIEFYISTLGVTSPERTTAHLLRGLIEIVQKNTP